MENFPFIKKLLTNSNVARTYSISWFPMLTHSKRPLTETSFYGSLKNRPSLKKSNNSHLQYVLLSAFLILKKNLLAILPFCYSFFPATLKIKFIVKSLHKKIDFLIDLHIILDNGRKTSSKK